VPDFCNTLINGKPANEVITDKAWLEGEFFTTVQQRGAAIIAARGQSSAMSAASSCIDHVHDLHFATPKGSWNSVCVPSDGSYGIPEGLIFSFPVVSDGKGGYTIVQGLKTNDFLNQKIKATTAELQQEKEIVADLLG
jgi:malate dehydrogenase